MTYVFTKTYPKGMFFFTGGWKALVVWCLVNGLVEGIIMMMLMSGVTP